MLKGQRQASDLSAPQAWGLSGAENDKVRAMYDGLGDPVEAGNMDVAINDSKLVSRVETPVVRFSIQHLQQFDSVLAPTSTQPVGAGYLITHLPLHNTTNNSYVLTFNV